MGIYDRVETLAREVRSTHNGLMSYLHTRRDHPTYGITKADLRERLAHLEGLAYAYGVMVTGEASATLRLQAEDVLDRYFDINLRGLHQRVKDS